MKLFKTTTFSRSKQQRYVLHASLSGNRGPVICLSAHPLGTYVASGGEFGTNIWHLPTLQLICGPAGPGDRGATTALAWITRTNDSDEGLAFGTENGYLCVWKQSPNKEWTETFCQRLTGGEDGQEIVSMAYDIGSAQLAVVHRSQAVHRFLINSSMLPNSLNSKSILKHWPQAVGFGQTSPRGPEIWTFGREDGVIYVLNENGTVIQNLPTSTVIGHAVISIKEDAMILDDVAQGIALYRLSTTERVRTFPVPSSERRSRNVAFHDGGSALVSGSDHGVVYIFDRRTGDVLDAIDMGVKDWVQSVTTTEMTGIPTIILGQSGENTGETLIQVWHKRSAPVAEVSRSAIFAQGPWLLCTILAVLFILEHILDLGVPTFDWAGFVHMMTGLLRMTFEMTGDQEFLFEDLDTL